MTLSNSPRDLPSVDVLMTAATELIDIYGREFTRYIIRKVLSDSRQRMLSEEIEIPTDIQTMMEQVTVQLRKQFRTTLQPVINATGVIIHTNLGRAPLSTFAQEAIIQNIAYNTLEFDLDTGQRGSRLIHAEALLKQITGAEAAIVVNNNAAATILILAAFASGKEVIMSRGQLVEIGGGFRVPEIMRQSGAKLIEVGTTNRTRINDYAHAINDQTALLMRVHSSNFKIIGFAEETPITDIANLAHEHNLYAVDDLGSGALIDTAIYGLEHEPTVQESVQANVDLIAFSGDKLLGGPQAGIIVGKQDLIDELKRHPLARALRADKITLAALSATLNQYRKGDWLEIPIWQMIARPLHVIRHTAEGWAAQLGEQATVTRSESTIGGGSLPGETLPTYVLSLTVSNPDEFMAALRQAPTPIIARIEQGNVLFDPRTILPDQEDTFIQTLVDIL